MCSSKSRWPMKRVSQPCGKNINTNKGKNLSVKVLKEDNDLDNSQDFELIKEKEDNNMTFHTELSNTGDKVSDNELMDDQDNFENLNKSNNRQKNIRQENDEISNPNPRIFKKSNFISELSDLKENNKSNHQDELGSRRSKKTIN